MTSASAIRLQIESALAHKIPSALSPAPRVIHPVAATGIEAFDAVLEGGLPLGAITEFAGPECSGRTSIALSFLARMTEAGKVCAWIDVSDALDPASAAAAGVDLERLLWVRCGVTQKKPEQHISHFSLPEKYLVPAAAKKGLHGGAFGPHPRSEVQGLSEGVSWLFSPRCAEPQPRRLPAKEVFAPNSSAVSPKRGKVSPAASKPWPRLEQALRAADLLLQGGGFSALVLDMGSLAPEVVTRVPLATWFRYRAAAERTQSSILLLTQHSCAKSSAELLLRLEPAEGMREEATVLTGMTPRIEVVRRRFTQENTLPLRKPPQSVRRASWPSRTAWAGRR
jgi:recombination protein RecA